MAREGQDLTETAFATDVPAPPSRRPRSALVIVVAALAFGAGALVTAVVRPAARPQQSPAPTTAAVEPVTQVARIVLPSTVRIKAGDESGSGFVYDAKGLILTAAHVVGSLDEVEVRMPSGALLDGKVLGRDERRDVAVVSVPVKKGTHLVAAKLAKSADVKVGQLAVAIGSPFGLVDSVSAGVVSGIGRSLPIPGGVVDAVQTDASVNPGNSGGPLADRFGRVIGINVATRGLGGNSVAFAIPIDVALQSARRLAVGATPPPVGFMGVSGTDGANGRAGALLTNVEPGSAGAKGGLHEGDLVVRIDAETLESMSQLASAIRRHMPGDDVRLEVVREGRTLRLTVEIAARP